MKWRTSDLQKIATGGQANLATPQEAQAFRRALKRWMNRNGHGGLFTTKVVDCQVLVEALPRVEVQ